jgi:hemerythrin-like domain-containing protein
MMTIVHDALRRDLRRATTALESAPAPGDRQRVAIADHLAWMMAFLRAHHESEDTGLYPAARERCPATATLLDEMHRDHERVSPCIDALEVAASTYGRNDGDPARVGLLDAIRHLEAVLLPHLAREEDEAMPLVSQALTHAEWQAIEEEHNLGPKPRAQLAKEGHWLIDDASDEDRTHVLGLVPPVPRFLLLHGYRRSYRQVRDACWRPSAGSHRVQKQGHNEVIVPAEPDAVWEVVLDITRVGEWSHECLECSFVGGAERAEPGARFRGRNRQGIFRWGRLCEVVRAEDHELVWRTVPTTLYPDSTEWRLRVSPADGGTRLEQHFQVVRAPKILDVVYATMVPAHRDRAAALTADLRRLGELASASTAVDRPVSAV